MVMLKETERKDKDSREAYYDIEAGNPDEDVTVRDGKRVFTWRRRKSNENITDKGFSFYLARRVFMDSNKIFDDGLATDPKNTGIYGMVKGDTKVMVVINAVTDLLDKGIIRIVSAYYTTNQKLVQKYHRVKKFREIIDSTMSADEENEVLDEYIKKIIEEREKTHPKIFF